jgi:hypothetical protein
MGYERPIDGALRLSPRADTTAGVHIRSTYEKWKKEARLDISTGPRTEVDGAQESAGGKNSQEAKTI